MARAKVVHSEDACTIIFKGCKNSPEPSTGVIKFPDGEIEVSRTSDSKYWAHVKVDDSANIVESRIDYNHDQWSKEGKIPPIPAAEAIEHMAIKVDGPYLVPGQEGRHVR